VGVKSVIHDVAIIGAGPAGIAAAIQLKRSGITPLLFEKTKIGGLLNNAYLVENYPGFPNGISGVKLVEKFKQHLKKWKIGIKKEYVTDVCRHKGCFSIKAKKNYRSKFVIIASGTKPIRLNNSIEEVKGKVFSEVYPLRNVRKKKIVIVGAGDAALDYTLNLSRLNHVFLINRSARIKGLDLLFRRIRKERRKENVTYMPQTSFMSVRQLYNCATVQLRNNRETIEMRCDYVLLAIGREPNTDFLDSSLRRSFPRGNNKDIFFIGDVKHGDSRQTSIAVGDGIQAAMRIYETLKTQKNRRDRRKHKGR